MSEKTAVTEMCGDTVKNSWKLVKLYTVNQAEQKRRSGLINCIGEQVTFMRLLFNHYMGIAQSVEQRPYKPCGEKSLSLGSSPSTHTIN